MVVLPVVPNMDYRMGLSRITSLLSLASLQTLFLFQELGLCMPPLPVTCLIPTYSCEVVKQ